MQNINKGLLIVYNTCTIGWDANGQQSHKAINQWTIDIKKILLQDIKNCKIVVTECRGSKSVQWDTGTKFLAWKAFLKKSDIDHIIVKEYLPFGQSVNHAVKTMINKNGRYEYYMYWSSGFELTPAYDKEDKTILSKIYNCMQTNKDVCRANLFASNDNYPPLGYDHNINTELYTIKPGYKIHDHCSIYSNDWVTSFKECIRPDIFKGNGSEPLFPYMASSIGKRCIILPKQICPALKHHKRSDGADNPGIGNRPNTGWYIKEHVNYNFTYLSANEIIEKNKRCKAAGILTRDDGNWTGAIMTSDRLSNDNKMYLNDRYGLDGMKLSIQDREELHKFISNEFFVKDFNYNNINGEMQ
jgi:hypothetical protein